MESGKSSATPINPGFRCAASGLQHLRHPDKLIERSPDGMQWNPGNIARVRQTPDSAKPVLSPSKGCIRATGLNRFTVFFNYGIARFTRPILGQHTLSHITVKR